jgi:D-glycero-alpha-D-manno-heptose 1-phosphate guanylyltransferase
LPFSLERLVFPAMVSATKMKAVKIQADFIDIGIPKDYFRFCRWIKAGRQGTLCL